MRKLIAFLIISVILFSCIKNKLTERLVEKPQTVSITINDNTSQQVLVK